jgi:hypothetical protein
MPYGSLLMLVDSFILLHFLPKGKGIPTNLRRGLSSLNYAKDYAIIKIERSRSRKEDYGNGKYGIVTGNARDDARKQPSDVGGNETAAIGKQPSDDGGNESAAIGK